jgi:GWxTD domain-containing protein
MTRYERLAAPPPRPRQSPRRRAALAAVAMLALGLAASPASPGVLLPADPATTQPRTPRPTAAESAAIAALAPKYRRWLEDVALLMSASERASFLGLSADYQRDAFLVAFWKTRDPYPDTARTEIEDDWESKVEQARSTFGSLDDVRSRTLLLDGVPAERIEISQRDLGAGDGYRCRGVVVPAEVWSYTPDNPTREELVLVFYRPGGLGPWRRWGLDDGVAALLVGPSAMLAGNGQGETLRLVGAACGDAGQALLSAIGWIGAQQGFKYELQVLRAESPPVRPSGEWLSTFGSYSTDLPADAATFPAELSFAFPGRRQNRTAVQGTVLVALDALGRAELGGTGSYTLLLNGEVLADGKLFDRFRYRFDVPAVSFAGAALPLVFERLLRPGDYRLVLKVEDLDGKRFFRVDRALTVPSVEGVVPPASPPDADTARMLAEANALLATGETTVRLLPPAAGDSIAGRSAAGGSGVLAGKVRFDALVTGEQVATVTFALDGQPILTKRVPPWSVELDLGHLPRSQTLRASAADASGRQLAADELVVNASAHRFAVTITEPAPQQHFRDSVRVVAKVEVPEGEHLEKLELYRDETLVATLYQPPWEQPILLPGKESLAYLRAVGYLPDGADTEDHVFINAPAGLEEVAVQLVELYTAVTDRAGRPVADLRQEQFAVKEDGTPQQLVRFEQVRDLPIKTAILLDTSASMEPNLEEAQRAALSFFSDIVTPKDRAALITFNDRPRLQVKFTNELLALGGGLAGLKAERARRCTTASSSPSTTSTA